MNLIEIEFKGHTEIISAWKNLFKHLGENHNRSPSEDISLPGLSDQEREERIKKFNKRLFEERQKLLAILLHKIAKKLGHKSEQLEIFEGGYTPQGWVDVDNEQALLRKQTLEIVSGTRAVKVAVVDYTNSPGDKT